MTRPGPPPTRVPDVVGLQLAVGQVPHLHVLVPARGHDDRVLVVRREPGEGGGEHGGGGRQGVQEVLGT